MSSIVLYTCRIVVAALVAVLLSPSSAVAARSVLVVDDDGVQCRKAAFTTVQSAVDAASPGDLVRVCPGRYVEQVVVDTPLTLQGRPDDVASLDCFDPSPTGPAGLDPARVPIIERPAATGAVDAVTLAADEVTMRGFVVQGAVNREGDFVSSGIRTDGRFSGFRVTLNLLRDNDLGIDFGGNGDDLSRADHNCMRDNDFGLAVQRSPLVHGLVDSNETFRNRILAYELGWFLAEVRSSVVRGNVSRQDALDVFRVEDTTDLVLSRNRVTEAGRGVVVYGSNSGLEVSRNTIKRTRGIGIIFNPPLDVPGVTTDTLVEGNVLKDLGEAPTAAIGIALARSLTSGSVDGITVTGNTIRRSNGIGISVQPLNPGVVVSDNTVRDNAVYGVIARPLTTGVEFLSNQMTGNGTYDAIDQGAGNRWSGNTCVTDFPTGTICGVP